MRIEDSVRKLYDALQKQKKVQEYVEQVKKKEYLAINNYIFTSLKKGTESFVVRLDDGEDYYVNPISVRVTKVRRKILKWDFTLLRSVLGRSRYEKVVNKTYTIIDMQGLVKYLKKCNADPDIFRKFIDVKTEVDENVLDSCIERGEIKEEEIKNCYSVELGEPYFRLTKIR